MSDDIFQKYKIRQENFDLYKPAKKYYDSTNVTNVTRMKAQEQIKQYANHKDLPYVSIVGYGMHRQRELICVYMLLSFPIAMIAGRIFSNEYYGIHNATHRISRCRWGTYAFLMGLGAIIMPSHVAFTPQNSNGLQPEYYERKIQRDLDLKLNLYQNVDLIINHDQRPSFADYQAVQRQIGLRALQEANIKLNNIK